MIILKTIEGLTVSNHWKNVHVPEEAEIVNKEHAVGVAYRWEHDK